jgi:copper/silver efflux system protein
MVDRIIDFSAKNRMLVILGVLAAFAGGLYSIKNITLDAIPDLSDPQVIVFTEWMGRSPTLIEDQVTYPLATSLLGAPKVTDVRGYSMFGMSFLYVLFEEGTDVYWARSRVLEYLDSAKARLPPDAKTTLGPDATGIGWVFQYALVDTSGKNDLAVIRTFQDFTLRYALRSVEGVAEVASVGGYEKEFQVTVDPDKLRARGISLMEVSQAVQGSNSDVGGRLLELSGREYFIRGRGYLTDQQDIEAITIKADARGIPIRVGDVARVQLGGQIRRGLGEWNGEGEAVGGIVVMRYGENALEVIERVKQKLEELKPSFPEGLSYEIAYDRSELIHRSIDTLTHSLFEEALVVSLVILIFLLHVRSAMLPILSLPVAVVLAFIPMYYLDIPSTIMSLGGIAIAIGATVDAEIVMVEACHKALEHLKPGEDRHAALSRAAKEVTPAIFFSLVIIAVSFLPVFALNGQAGRLFKPLAYTKTFTMLAAALLSITFAPALRDLLLKGKIHSEQNHPVSRFIIALYKPFVFVALRRPMTTVLIGLFAVASALPIFFRLGSEFMSPLNEGDILYMPITMPNLSIEAAKEQLQIQDRILKSFPEVEAVYGKVGRAETATDPAPLSMVETMVKLKPREKWPRVREERWYSAWAPEGARAFLGKIWPEERPETYEELVAKMNEAMQFPGWTNAFTQPIRNRVDMLTTGIRTPIGIKVFGARLAEIEGVGEALEPIISMVPGTRSVFYERNLGGLYIDVIPSKEKLARYGLSVAAVEELVEAGIGGMPIGYVVDGRARFSINVRYPRDLRDDVEALRKLPVPLPTRGAMAGAPTMGGTMSSAQGAPMAARPGGLGPSITLGEVAEIRVVDGPPMIRDEDGLLAGYVYVDIDASRDIGGYVKDAKAAVEAARSRGELRLPSGVYLEWTGQYELLEAMLARMKLVVPIALGLVVLLLYLQFKNFIEVLIVLLSIPFALVGSVWLLYLLDYRLSTAVWVGVIALIGLAAQTGIVMIVYIDHAYERRKKAGKIRDLDDIIWAHMEGTVMRVRPKLMTVSTMLIGLVPLLWATGSGADVMKRIAAPMVGGLLSSAFLTLEIIPVIYTYWRYAQLKAEKRRAAETKEETL